MNVTEQLVVVTCDYSGWRSEPMDPAAARDYLDQLNNALRTRDGCTAADHRIEEVADDPADA